MMPKLAIVLALAAISASASPAMGQASPDRPQAHRDGSARPILHRRSVPASAGAAWDVFADPGSWWIGSHSYTGDAANLELRLERGGCLCEKLPGDGFAEHFRVITVMPGRLARMRGAPVPLQSEPATGVLTIRFADGASAGETTIALEFRLEGAAPSSIARWWEPVDGALSDLMDSLAAEITRRAEI
jgi:hypothetical protein